MANNHDDSEILPNNKSVSASKRNVLAILILAAVLTIHWRSSWLMNDPLWLDELHSVWVVNRGIDDVFVRAAAGNQSPLYYWLGYLSASFLDVASWIALRGISAFAGGALVVLAGWTAWRWTGKLSALIASVAATVCSGNQLFYSTEARPYELLCLVGLVHCLLFLRWLRETVKSQTVTGVDYGIRLAMLLAAVGVIGVLIHPLAILLILAEMFVTAVCLLSCQSKNRKYLIVSAPILYLMPLLIFAVLLLWLGHTVVNRELWSSVVSVDLTLTEMVRGLVVPATVLVFGMVVDRSAIKRDDRGAITGHFAFALLSALYVLVGFGVCIATLPGIAPLAMPRYCMAVAAIPIVLTGLAVGMIQSVRWRLCAAIFSVVALFFVPLPTNFQGVLSGRPELANLSGFGWNGRQVSFAGSSMRNEPWEEVWKLVLHHDHVFLLSNILEDSLLEPKYPCDDVQRISPGISLAEYLLFPSVNSGHFKLQPTRTLLRPRFDRTSLRLENFGIQSGESLESAAATEYWTTRFWLVVRGRPETAEDAITEFLQVFEPDISQRYKPKIEERVFGDLIVFLVELPTD